MLRTYDYIYTTYPSLLDLNIIKLQQKCACNMFNWPPPSTQINNRVSATVYLYYQIIDNKKQIMISIFSPFIKDILQIFTIIILGSCQQILIIDNNETG